MGNDRGPVGEWKDIEIRGACEIVHDNHHGREMILLARPMIAVAQHLLGTDTDG
jgi:hypothetical protein